MLTAKVKKHTDVKYFQYDISEFFKTFLIFKFYPLNIFAWPNQFTTISQFDSNIQSTNTFTAYFSLFLWIEFQDNFRYIIFNLNYSFKMTWTINPVKSRKHLEANSVIICFKRGHVAWICSKLELFFRLLRLNLLSMEHNVTYLFHDINSRILTLLHVYRGCIFITSTTIFQVSIWKLFSLQVASTRHNKELKSLSTSKRLGFKCLRETCPCLHIC